MTLLSFHQHSKKRERDNSTGRGVGGGAAIPNLTGEPLRHNINKYMYVHKSTTSTLCLSPALFFFFPSSGKRERAVCRERAAFRYRPTNLPGSHLLTGSQLSLPRPLHTRAGDASGVISLNKRAENVAGSYLYSAPSPASRD